MSRPHPIKWLRTHPRAADAILAAVVTVTAVVFHLLDLDQNVGTTMQFRSPTWWTTLLVVASTLPISWRRTFPIRSGLFVAAAQIVTALLDIDGTGFLGVLIALYSLGAHSSGRRRANAMWAIGCSLVVLFVLGMVTSRLPISDLISSTVVLATAFVLGDNLRRRREKADSLAERAERAEREQVLIAQQQVAAERTRIARELHDVVAHSVSVMIIQAAAARRNLHVAPDVAATALGNIEATGRQTMTELRGILGVLRGDGDEDLRAPQPLLSDIADLVEASSDLPINLRTNQPPDDTRVGGPVSDLDGMLPSVALTAYRVVQESITNIRRHAGPVTAVDIDIEHTATGLKITVADDGRGAAADGRGSGFGVIGIRERAAAIGGTATAGPRAGGGWCVAVDLPVRSDPAATLDLHRTTSTLGVGR